MVGQPFPSGDPAADRRAAFAETLAHLGDLSGAIDVLEGALALAPDWHAGWFRLGEFYESGGATEEAIAAWSRAVAADPRDPLGAGVKRDLLTGKPVSDTLPPAFVETLFDQYAPRFEASLVDRLGYRVPEVLMDTLTAAGVTHAPLALDLGCGTGLMGALLRPRVDWLGGYDISAGMLAEARAKGLYDRLEKADIGALPPADRRYDLIVAADVFLYLGALDKVMSWCVGALTPNGTLAFSVEAAAPDEPPIALRDSRRFAHTRAYLEELLSTAGFAHVTMSETVLRMDRGAPVHGFVALAQGLGTPNHTERDGEAEALV